MKRKMGRAKMKGTGLLQKAAVISVLLFAIGYAIIPASAQNQSSVYTLAQAKESIKNSQNAVNYMQGLGLNTDYARDMLNDANIFLENGDYGSVIETGGSIMALRDDAVSLRKKISNSRELLEDGKKLSLNVSGIEELLNQGTADFEIGNYEASSPSIEKSLAGISSLLGKQLESLIPAADSLQNLASGQGIELSAVNSASEEIRKKLSAGDFTGTSVLKSRILALNSSVHGLVSIRESVRYAESMNITHARFNDLYNEAFLSIELGQYANAEKAADESANLRGFMGSFQEERKNAEALIGELHATNLDASGPEKLLAQADEKFLLEDYGQAESLARSAAMGAQEVKASSLLFGVVSKSRIKFSLLEFLKKYWWAAALAAIAAGVSGIFIYRILSARLLRMKISSLRKEEKAMIEMIKKSQADYFARKSISRESYNLAVDQYQERLLRIKEELPVLESLLGKRTGKDSGKNNAEETKV
ncbi:hypothetical protein J4212_00560 [Candidatus Woesearchaeota archaeon]|nr:hypothetical protein [Candidatus Woesearchaeota archaeon]